MYQSMSTYSSTYFHYAALEYVIAWLVLETHAKSQMMSDSNPVLEFGQL